MGSGSSHHVGSSSSSPQSPKVNRTKQRLASLLCGASQKEDCEAESLVNKQKAKRSLTPTNDSSPRSGFINYSSPSSGLIASSESSSMSSENVSIQNDPQVESSTSTNKRKCFLEGDENVSHGINDEIKCYQQRRVESVNPSSSGQLQNVVSLSDMPHTSPDVSSPNGLEVEQPTCLEEFSEITGRQSSESDPNPVVTDPEIGSQSLGEGAIQEQIPLESESSVGERLELESVNVVRISSNNEISTLEARRNSRRVFWDAFSSRSSRRNAEFPAVLFTNDGSDLMRSHRRWLLDFGDDFFDEPLRSTRRTRFSSSRSQYEDRLRGFGSENSHRSMCPLNLHSDGSCTCELDEEASALSSISRIILLAEALFEVLDEIHRQPESLSLSMLSVPAPESIVDSLPLKTYEKTTTIVDDGDVDQCYICLVEYEKGDKIRELPCHHSYHMSCVDKWLKEIHGVCPLCRGDVQEGAREATTSSSDADLS